MDKSLNENTSPPRRPARDKLLAAATELFYQEGVRSVGIDRVIAHAGVAKASLYGNFKNKEELVAAYLTARYEARRAAIEVALAQRTDPRARLLAIFDVAAEAIAQPDYRGCAFARASAEMADDAAGRQVCLSSRQWTRDLLTRLAKEAGAKNPQALGGQLQLLYDGMAAAAGMKRDPGIAVEAKAAAELFVDAACKP